LKPVELPFFVWNLNLTGFLPEPEGGGFSRPVGKKTLSTPDGHIGQVPVFDIWLLAKITKHGIHP
jgi:hypothetical protein